MISRDKPTGKESAGPATSLPATTVKETGWLPDCVFTGGKFESGLAFFADALGRITRFSREPADLAAARRMPGQAALPGLVNAHSQSWQRVLRGRFELRGRADRESPGNWLEREEHALRRISADDLYDIARLAFMEMLLSGVTCVGEAHFLHRGPDAAPWDEPLLGARTLLRAARDVGLRISLLNGAWQRAGFGQPPGSAPARCGMATADEFVRETEALREYIAKNLPGDDLWIGVAAAGPGAVALDDLKAIAAYAHAKRLRLHLPLGASPSETQACAAEYGRSPAALLGEHGLLDKRFVAVHGVYLNDDDVRTIGAARVTVCACPASALHLGDGGISADRLLEAGAVLALGTAGPFGVGLLDQARLIEFQVRSRARGRAVWPGEAAQSLWQAATVTGARSLGAPGGALEAGRPADFFTVNLFDPALAGAAPEQLLDAIVFASGPRAIREVWVGARQRVSQWRHPAQSAAIGRFTELQKRLWSA